MKTCFLISTRDKHLPILSFKNRATPHMQKCQRTEHLKAAVPKLKKNYPGEPFVIILIFRGLFKNLKTLKLKTKKCLHIVLFENFKVMTKNSVYDGLQTL